MSDLSDVKREFEKVGRVMERGEGAWDRMCYGLSTAWLAILENQRRGLLAARRHGVMALLIFTVPIAMAVALVKYFVGRLPDKDSEELARAIQEQREKAAQTEARSETLAFYDGAYSITAPRDWDVYDRESIDRWLDSIEKVRDSGEGEIVKVAPAMSNFVFDSPLSANGIYGFMVMPSKDGGEAHSIVIVRVLKQTKAELDGTSEETQTGMFKHLVATRREEVEPVSLRRYMDRHDRDTILFMGQTERSVAVSYIFPQETHTVTVSAVMPKELFEGDMPKFLHIVDGLTRL
jgi:hypothetical protein